MKTLPGILLFAIGVILLIAYFFMPSIVEDVDLRQIFILLPGVILAMAGPIVAYTYYKTT